MWLLAHEDVAGIVNRRVGIQPGFQAGQPNNGFEDGAGGVVLLGRAILLRFLVRDALRIRQGQPGNVHVWIEGRSGGHRQNVPVGHVHERPLRLACREPKACNACSAAC